MAKRQAMTVGGITFKTKKDLQAYCQEILYRYIPGQILNDADREFIADLLRRHQSAAEKIGCGVASIGVHRTDYGNQGFMLVRMDGTSTDFSFLHCITPRSKWDDFKKACRNTVFPQIQAFKSQAFAYSEMVPCAVTGELLAHGDSHVDHIPPDTFDRILLDFLELNDVDHEAVEITGYGDWGMEKNLADEKLSMAWADYHKSRARLRIVSKIANLSIVKRNPTDGHSNLTEP